MTQFPWTVAASGPTIRPAICVGTPSHGGNVLYSTWFVSNQRALPSLEFPRLFNQARQLQPKPASPFQKAHTTKMTGKPSKLSCIQDRRLLARVFLSLSSVEKINTSSFLSKVFSLQYFVPAVGMKKIPSNSREIADYWHIHFALLFIPFLWPPLGVNIHSYVITLTAHRHSEALHFTWKCSRLPSLHFCFLHYQILWLGNVQCK